MVNYIYKQKTIAHGVLNRLHDEGRQVIGEWLSPNLSVL